MRKITATEERDFGDYLEIHFLTQQWQEAGLTSSEPMPSDPLSQKILLRLRKAKNAGLSDFLEDSFSDFSAKEFLDLLKQTAWKAQAAVLSEAIQQNSKKPPPAIPDPFKQITHQAGLACAERRWPRSKKAKCNNLKEILGACRANPFFSEAGREFFLIKRATETEILLELLYCPHQSPIPEIQSISDELCSLHSLFLQGFISHFNAQISVKFTLRPSLGQRCTQHWVLAASGDTPRTDGK